MTQVEKQLLVKDLCARFPYGVICRLSVKGADVSITEELKTGGLEHFINGTMDVKPYLRPMSSMTEEERHEYNKAFTKVLLMRYRASSHYPVTDWLLAHHFDFRELIEKGLALEAPEKMYKQD